MAEVNISIPDITLVVKGLLAGEISGAWLDGLDVLEVDISAGPVSSLNRILQLTNPNAAPANIEVDINWSASSNAVVSDIALDVAHTLPLVIPANGTLDLTVVYTVKPDVAHNDTVVVSGGGVAITQE